MAPASRKRARGGAGSRPKNKKRVRHAGPSSTPGEGGKKNPTSPTMANLDSKQGSVSNNVEDAARPSKKIRVGLEDSHDVSAPSMPESHIFTLPPEIIGEILILTGSPRHVLAFARTCKHFCYTLIGEGAQYIWRQARRGPQCSILKFNFAHHVKPDLGVDVISLPDPPKAFFNEAAYAAFIFDPGLCDNCGKQTSAQYASFALRIRICNNPSCNRLPDGLSNPDQFELIVPTIEKTNILAGYTGVVAYWPLFPLSGDRFSRKTDLVKAREEFLSESNGVNEKIICDGVNEKRLETLRTRNKEWMHFCSALAKWKTAFKEKYRTVKAANEVVARHAADMFGWVYADMIVCTVFGSFCHQRTSFLENVVISDVYPMQDQIESELLALEEKRQRRKQEIALIDNREDVEALYNKLRLKKKYEYLPSLPTFRQLPIIQLLQAGIYDRKYGTRISDTLQNNPLMRQQLEQEVKRWIETAKQDLAVVLGFPRQWKSANKKVLHPVERCTAWFLCTKCGTAGNNSQTDGSLDFTGACLHVCRDKNKNDRFRRSKRAAWNPGNFIKDEKAINVTKSALSKRKLSEETEDESFLRQQVFAVICTSCEPSMVVDSRTMIGHCHRHESMELSFVSREEVISHLNGFTYPYGIVAKLFRHGGQAVQKEIDKKNFGCRICLRRKQTKDTTVAVPDSGASANPTGAEDHTDSSPFVSTLDCPLSHRPKEMPPLFNFNGMRSHLKAKHGIENIRDEDFFCAEKL